MTAPTFPNYGPFIDADRIEAARTAQETPVLRPPQRDRIPGRIPGPGDFQKQRTDEDAQQAVLQARQHLESLAGSVGSIDTEIQQVLIPQVLSLEARAAGQRAKLNAHLEDRKRRQALLLEAIEQYREAGIKLDLTVYEEVARRNP